MDNSILQQLQALAGPYLDGLRITLEILVITTILALVLSVPLALARLSASVWLRWPAAVYSGAMRGTPLLAQLFVIYYGLPQIDLIRHTVLWSIFSSSFACAILAFTLNMAAYLGEVVRGGILAVPHGEVEAARAFGMRPSTRLRRIVLPRAFRLVLPALSSEVVIQLKATALASVITLVDLTGVARRLMARSYSTDPLLIAGAIYIVLTFGIATLFTRLERRLNPQRRTF